MTALKGWGIVILSVFVFFGVAQAGHSGFDPNNLIDDSDFIDVNGFSVSGISQFLTDRNSCLKNYIENGRSAAQIIYDAAHGYGDATASVNGISVNVSTGTVNPEVILVTLQKEQSLVSSSSCSQATVNKAMGFGCPDGGSCNPDYAGFAKQVENGAWQLRYNYERAQGRGFGDYQVGQNQCFADVNGTNCATFSNRATAALYRYTPHVYNGNHNFDQFYRTTYDFRTKEYEGTVVSWSSSDGSYVYPTLIAGDAGTNLVVRVQNTGRTTWKQNTVHLATARSRDRVTPFLRESGNGSPTGWLRENRIEMKEGSVAPGQVATFSFWIRAPGAMSSGTYREHFELVADEIAWFPERGIYYDVTVVSKDESYKAEVVSWSSSGGPYTYPVVNRGGFGGKFSITMRNTGKATWTKGTVNLGTAQPRDRIPGFERESGYNDPSGWVSPNRIAMQEQTVAPGQSATFVFWLRALPDKPLGAEREHFELVADSVTWFPERGIYWDITVQ